MNGSSSSPNIDLSQLKDIHLPDDISWWPLAIGWWLLITILPTILTLFFVYFYRQKKAKVIQKMTLELLDNAYIQDASFLLSAHSILKRYCRQYYPEALSLTGENWVEFLNSAHSKKHDTIFSSSLSNALNYGIYSQDSDYDREKLLASCRLWIECHRPKFKELSPPHYDNRSHQ
jgi:hypothetical protein